VKNRITEVNRVSEWLHPYPPTLADEPGLLELDLAELANFPMPTKEDHEELERLQARELANWLKPCC
jgi:hypothetical protein